MGSLKRYRNGQFLFRLTGDDVNNRNVKTNAGSEWVFYSIVFVIGILALGIVWN